ncbi:MAG: bleomycin resistance protein [Candidatus Kapaibacterium sp.]|nr:MAG: bleomycin resistance protein [Candidatus Kapabacteria bacterium]
MATILQNHYVLAVHNVKATAEFFGKLGFTISSEPPGWIFVERDNCMIMLGDCRASLPAENLGDHSYFGYLLVNNAAEFYEEVRKNGVLIHHALADKPWGMREFGVQSPEGHRIMIGEVIL